MRRVDANAVAAARAAHAGAPLPPVARECYAPGGQHLPSSLRWAATYHNEAAAHTPHAANVRDLVRIRVGEREDMGTVMAMIRSLAEFEREPDAVKTDESVLLRDGFGPGALFTVLLLEVPTPVDAVMRAGEIVGEGGTAVADAVRNAAGSAPSDTSSGGPRPAGFTALGFAFFFAAYSTWEGRVLYLEDLYTEPHARRQGISGSAMALAARAARVSDCARVCWAALKWNTPAINAYLHPRVGAVALEEWTPFRLTREGIERVAGLALPPLAAV